jgi:hypothetical protein
MRYLCLIYDDQTKLAARSKSEADAFPGEYVSFTDAIRRSGHYLAGEALQSVQTATTVRVRGGRSPRPMGPSPKRRSSWAASTSSTPGT